ncbi:rhodanese-like domain-containing protein [Aureispira sp. CCB-QB1]|nr:rhodanese-like domain-containing protein [Aureispira sp. CCB-QB1]
MACLICFFILNNATYSFAQNDPFGFSPSSSQDAAALSPNELPDFEAYCKDPENIRIPPILAKELEYVIKTNNREQIIIIDARSKEEYEISHIQGARRTGYKDFSIERVWMVSRKARVIVYSANKNRSTVVAQYLKLMGFTDVQVLEDGLIGWKNEGNSIYDKNGATDKIHVGNRTNLKLVKSGLAIY